MTAVSFDMTVVVMLLAIDCPLTIVDTSSRPYGIVSKDVWSS
jgi:hypothetical protein